MITGLLQNIYICISNKSKAQILDLTKISQVLKLYKKYSITKLCQVLVGRSVFGQHKDGQQHLFTINVSRKQRFNMNSKKIEKINK